MNLNKLSVVVDAKNDTDSGFDDVVRDADKMGFKLLDIGKKTGDKLGSLLGDGATAGLAGIGKDPRLAAAAAAAGATMTPILGAAMSAAIIGGAGAAGLIGGLMLIKDDPRIQEAGKGLGDKLLTNLRDSASVAIDPVLGVIDKISDRIDTWTPLAANFFANTFDDLDGLIDPLLGGLDSVIAAGAELSEEFTPIFDALGLAGEEFMEGLADGLGDIQGAAPNAIQFIGDMGKGIGKATEATLWLIAAAAKLYTAFRPIGTLIWDIGEEIWGFIKWIASGIDWLGNKISSSVSSAWNKLDGLRDSIGSVGNIIGFASGGAVGAASQISHAAEGGSRGGLALVGEQGPEFIRLPYGSSVMSSTNSRIHAEQSGMVGGGGRVILDFRNFRGNPLAEAVVSIVQEAVRTQGGGNVEFLAGN